MKKRDYESIGMPAPDYFDNSTDPNDDDGFYFPTDFHAPTPEDEEYWEEEEDDDDGDDGDGPSTYAHCGDWEDEPENCASCADDECPLNKG